MNTIEQLEANRIILLSARATAQLEAFRANQNLKAIEAGLESVEREIESLKFKENIWPRPQNVSRL